MALDNSEGVVKTNFHLAVREHRWIRQIGLRTKHSGDHAFITFRWRYFVATNHRFGRTAAMIVLCEHPVAVGPVRKWETRSVFQGAVFAPSFAPVGLDARALIQSFGLFPATATPELLSM